MIALGSGRFAPTTDMLHSMVHQSIAAKSSCILLKSSLLKKFE